MEYTIDSGVHGSFHGGRPGPPKLKHKDKHTLNESDIPYKPNEHSLENEWHVYAVEWTPDELQFYIDGVHYGTTKNGDPLPTHVLDSKPVIDVGDYPVIIPESVFFLILNTTVKKYDFPKEKLPRKWKGLEHKIDYVRVYEACELNTKGCEVLQPWVSEHGSGKGKLAYWNMSSDDVYLAADFDADGRDELLVLNKPWVHLIERKQTSTWHDAWYWRWGTGSGKIAYWNMNDDDRYLAGNFVSESGTPRSELLAISDAWWHVMRFNGSDWRWLSGNGSGKLGTWNISSDDKYLVGNFDGSGTD